MQRIFTIGLTAVLVGAGVAAATWGWIQWRYDRLVITDLAAAPETPVALVFGAGIRADGRLSPMLADRMDTAIALYQAGKVRKLLVSGDNRFVDYDEPGRMYDYAVARGVPAADVVRDYAGRRTYDTCYRAKAIFGVERALLITQRFHLPRASSPAATWAWMASAFRPTAGPTGRTTTIASATPSPPCAPGGT